MACFTLSVCLGFKLSRASGPGRSSRDETVRLGLKPRAPLSGGWASGSQGPLSVWVLCSLHLVLRRKVMSCYRDRNWFRPSRRGATGPFSEPENPRFYTRNRTAQPVENRPRLKCVKCHTKHGGTHVPQPSIVSYGVKTPFMRRFRDCLV